MFLSCLLVLLFLRPPFLLSHLLLLFLHHLHLLRTRATSGWCSTWAPTTSTLRRAPSSSTTGSTTSSASPAAAATPPSSWTTCPSSSAIPQVGPAPTHIGPAHLPDPEQSLSLNSAHLLIDESFLPLFLFIYSFIIYKG